MLKISKQVFCWSLRGFQPLRLLSTTSILAMEERGTEQTSQQVQGQAKVKINDAWLYYELQGTGPHPIVCIPGALGTIESDFRPQMDYFGREGSDFTIVSFDPRGYGKSRPEKRFEKGDNFFLTDARDAHTLMQALSFPKYSVIGWSDGGIASLILASEYPNSVQKLVALGANASIAKEDIELYEKLRDVSTWSAKMRDPLVEVYGNSLQELWSTWMDSVLAFQSQNDGDICSNELAKITCPTLIVQGAKDPMVPSFHATYLRDKIRGSKLEVFEEGKHNLHLRFHQEFNKMVEEFLKL